MYYAQHMTDTPISGLIQILQNDCFFFPPVALAVLFPENLMQILYDFNHQNQKWLSI